jgi:hypothetical protein
VLVVDGTVVEVVDVVDVDDVVLDGVVVLVDVVVVPWPCRNLKAGLRPLSLLARPADAAVPADGRALDVVDASPHAGCPLAAREPATTATVASSAPPAAQRAWRPRAW